MIGKTCNRAYFAFSDLLPSYSFYRRSYDAETHRGALRYTESSFNTASILTPFALCLCLLTFAISLSPFALCLYPY